MKKILCGLGVALTLALSGCAPPSNETPATPRATSTTTSRADQTSDVANVDLSAGSQSGSSGEFGTNPPSLGANGSELPTNNTNPAGTDAGNKALEGNLAEQQLASLALTHAQRADVKEVAEMIKADHRKAETELRAAAGSSLPVTALTEEHQKTKARLEGLSGGEFDKAFIDAMVADHEKTLKFYQNQAKVAPTQPLKDYFARTAPVIEKHLEHCRRVQNSLG